MSRELIIQYSTSFAWASWVIRAMCHSRFSHVDIVIPGEGLLGVSGSDKKLKDPGGVVIRPFEAWEYKDKETITLRTNTADDVIRIAKTQLDKPFDNSALYRFLGPPYPRNWRELDRWFCSELVIWALEEAVFFPYQLVQNKDRVTPADSLLFLNPFMSSVDIAKFRER